MNELTNKEISNTFLTLIGITVSMYLFGMEYPIIAVFTFVTFLFGIGVVIRLKETIK